MWQTTNGLNGSVVQRATYSVCMQTVCISFGFIYIPNQNVSNGAIWALSIQLWKLLSASLWPAVTETEHVIGLIEMTFSCLYGEGHLRVRVSRCWCRCLFFLILLYRQTHPSEAIKIVLACPPTSYCDYHLLKPSTTETAFTVEAAGWRA